MKKLLENKWVDHVLKALITIALGAILIITVDINMFVKYVYPAEKARQQEQINNIVNLQKECKKNNDEQNSNSNKRIDVIRDRVIPIEVKINTMYDLMLRNEKLTSQK